MDKKKYPNLESEKNYQNNLFIEVDTSRGFYSGESLKEIINEINDDYNGSCSCVKAIEIRNYLSDSDYDYNVLSDRQLQIFNKFLAAKLDKVEDEEEIEDDPMGFELARKELQDQLL